MNLYRKNNLRPIHKLQTFFLATIGVFSAYSGLAQDSIAPVKNTTTAITDKIKVDGIAAVVGDFVILDSDIDKMYLELESQGVDMQEVTRCGLLGNLMENKLYAHQAIQDSIVVTDVEVRQDVDRKIGYFVQQLGSMEKLLSFYKVEDEASFRAQFTKIVKEGMLTQRMQSKIVDKVEITPEEVRQFFVSIEKEDLPIFGTELEISQIIKKPRPAKEQVEKVKEKLKKIKTDVETLGVSFATKAILYSQDRATGGGVLQVEKKSGFVKEFKDVAFSLQEGEISEPFETDFGWHIIYLEKVRGRVLDVRHILLIPEITAEQLTQTKQELDTLRKRIMDKELTFAQAARSFSDQKQTKFDGGKLINPTTQDTRFELTKMDPTLYNQVRDLAQDAVSFPLLEEERTGKQYKLLQVTNKYPEHTADYAKDYLKIKELALKQKQLQEIQKWMQQKIKDTYIYVSNDNISCSFKNNWLKK